MEIKLHEIYYTKLTGEKVWVDHESTVTPGNYICRRVVHTHDDGDLYRDESFHPDELISREQFQHQANLERMEIAKILKANGLTLLDSDNPLSHLFEGEKN